MNASVPRDVGTAVYQAPVNNQQIDPVGQHMGGGGVAQVMEAHVR